MIEYNLEEAVKNNSIGAKNVAEVADEFDIERFVLISTEKVRKICRPYMVNNVIIKA